MRLSDHIRGNANTLARLFIIAASIGLAIYANLKPWNEIKDFSSALLGAAVAMLAELLATFIGQRPASAVEKLSCFASLTKEIKEDLVNANFYRERQRLIIRAEHGLLEYEFTSKIKIIDKERRTPIEKQIILEPAEGLSIEDDIEFRVGNIKYAKDQTKEEISNDTSDYMTVKFKFNDANLTAIVDTHVWASAITDYSVSFISNDYKCELTAVRGKMTARTLTKNAAGEYDSFGPALPGEILRIKIERES